MTNIICAVLSGIALILVAVINNRSAQRDKLYTEREQKSEERAEQRAKESLLSMQLMNANCKLTVGVAMAQKRGHANGEIEDGLKAVEEATKAYEEFHAELLARQLTK